MKNVILDTNVLMSGIFFGGVPARILELWYRGMFQIVLTKEILSEYIRVHEELMVRYPNITSANILNIVMSKARVVKPHRLFEQVCSDVDDDTFIACALSCNGVIISGDKALLNADGYQGVSILTPRRFVNGLSQ